MSTRNYLHIFYLSHLSKPSADRSVYRAIGRAPVEKVLELGMGGAGRRAQRIIELTRLLPNAPRLRYTAIDLFETNPSPTGTQIPLKAVYQQLRATGSAVQLLPGNPLQVLSLWANSLPRFDLVLISPCWEPACLAAAWFYLPRITHADSLIFLEEISARGRSNMRQIGADELAQLASAAASQRRAAA